MTAKTQYSDFVGSAAAEFKDADGFTAMSGLSNYAGVMGIDVANYKPVGVRLSRGQGGTWFVQVQCTAEGLEPSSEEKVAVVSFSFMDSWENISRRLIGRIDIHLVQRFFEEDSLEVVEERSIENPAMADL